MYVGDYDNNGTMEQILTCYNGDSSYPMLLRHDLVSVLPYLKKKYLKYADYKNETVNDIFTQEQLNTTKELKAYCMESSVFLNNRDRSFLRKSLPPEAQLSSMYGIAAEDFDDDGNLDIILGGNFYDSKPEVGIYDGSYGCVLKGNGKGDFTAMAPQKTGILFKGAIRDFTLVKAKGTKILLVAYNNQATGMLELKMNKLKKQF